MNTLEVNRFTNAWRELGESLPRPRAILCISAHWFIQGSAITAMPQPRVIHDFFGFPPELFAFDYPAPGAPEIAQEIADAVQPSFVALDQDSWGLDHGAWSVLAHVFPRADIPVLQLSLHGGESAQYHLDLGARLAPLRDRGIFIIASGNVVHNLRRLDWNLTDRVFDWGERFDSHVKQVMTSDPRQLATAHTHPDYRPCVPTPEHFLPLLYIAGIASASGDAVTTFAEGGTMGAITMTSYLVGGRQQAARQPGSSEQAPLPDPRDVPPEQTNL